MTTLNDKDYKMRSKEEKDEKIVKELKEDKPNYKKNLYFVYKDKSKGV